MDWEAEEGGEEGDGSERASWGKWVERLEEKKWVVREQIKEAQKAAEVGLW